MHAGGSRFKSCRLHMKDLNLYICSRAEEGCPGCVAVSKMLPQPVGATCMACREGHYIKYEEPKYVGWRIEDGET